MPRPKRPPHLAYMRDSFSGPAYIVTAARVAAGVPEKQFAPWLMSAIEAKLQRENPGLLEETRARLAEFPADTGRESLRAAEPPAKPDLTIQHVGEALQKARAQAEARGKPRPNPAKRK